MELAESYLKDKSSWQPELFLGTLRELVDKEGTKEVLDILKTDKYKPMVESIAWDIFPIVTPHISNAEENNEMFKDCADILNVLAEVGKPKEMILGFLEQLDRFLDDTSYRTLLKPITTVLMRFGLTKSYHLNQTFVLLHMHIQTIKFPSSLGMDEHQRRLLLEDPAILRLGSSTMAVLDFLAPFVFEVEQMLYGKVRKLTTLEKTEMENCKVEITKLVLRILDYPLARTDLVWTEMEEDSNAPRHKSDFRLCAEQALTYLARMRFSFTRLLHYGNEFKLPVAPSEEEDELGEEDRGPGDIGGMPPMGIGCFLYLVMAEELQSDRLPSIYRSDYLLEVMSVFITALLRKSQEEAVYKGLRLLSLLVESIEDGSLHHSLLSNTFYEDLPQMLSVVMVMSPLNLIRQAAFKVFPVYIHKFDWKGRYRLLRILLKNTVHSGVCGFVIGKVKDYFIHSSQHHDNDWFVGQRLADLYPLIFVLPNGPESDLLESSDKVMAALNFLRFLLLRDTPTSNESCIWSRIDHINGGYLTDLHTGLGLSMAHYQFKIDSLIKESKTKGSGSGKPKMQTSLSVAGHQLPVMPPTQQMHVLKSACCTFELMQSIVGRVRDLLAANERSAQEPMQVEGDSAS
ncbi:glomulin-like [Diadema antillarum]|uniref:glomulin-like n=1 Tax=Diadema antillarum TaxID=105358 RepID=UPI003A841278